MIEPFLHNVKRDKDGKGTCSVSYTRCTIGQALVDAQLLRHTRIYPDKWPSCATQLGKRLRSLALGRYYEEADDEHAFRMLLQSLPRIPHAVELIERIVTDTSLKVDLSKHYFADEEHTDEVKQLLHAMSNGGAVGTWRANHRVGETIADHDFITRFGEAMDQVTDELATNNNGPAGVKLIVGNLPTK